jgi:hypothetical protein
MDMEIRDQCKTRPRCWQIAKMVKKCPVDMRALLVDVTIEIYSI